MRNFKNFRTFENHVSTFHRGPAIEDEDSEDVSDSGNGTEECGEVDFDGELFSHVLNHCLLQKSSAWD